MLGMTRHSGSLLRRRVNKGVSKNTNFISTVYATCVCLQDFKQQLLLWAGWEPRIIKLYVLCHTLERRLIRLIRLIEKLNRFHETLISDKSCIGYRQLT
jgi:hypothetical protein